jgi:hypothetical protein
MALNLPPALLLLERHPRARLEVVLLVLRLAPRQRRHGWSCCCCSSAPALAAHCSACVCCLASGWGSPNAACRGAVMRHVRTVHMHTLQRPKESLRLVLAASCHAAS